MAQSPNQSQGTDTVTVGCKLPHGLILRAFTTRKGSDYYNGAMREVDVAEPVGEPFRINGNAFPEGMSPQGYKISGGFALTPGVPKELFDTWMKQNKDSDVVKNGLIFAHSQESSAFDMAKDRHEKRSGFERLNPEKLPQEFQGKISTAVVS